MYAIEQMLRGKRTSDMFSVPTNGAFKPLTGLSIRTKWNFCI